MIMGYLSNDNINTFPAFRPIKKSMDQWCYYGSLAIPLHKHFKMLF